MARLARALPAGLKLCEEEKRSSCLLANVARAFPSKLIQLLPKVQLMSPLSGICEQHSARIARASGGQSEHYCWPLTAVLARWLAASGCSIFIVEKNNLQIYKQ